MTTIKQRRIKRIRIHRTRQLDPRDISECKRIPITTVPRTLVDLAAELPEEELAVACHNAGVIYKTTPAHVKAVLSRRPNSPGAKKLMRIMEGDVKVSLSRLERRFLQLLRANELPEPLTNRIADARRVDCRWPDHHLTVELDGFQFHNSRRSWEQDRQREREARGRGDEFRRFTYADVFEAPAYMLAQLQTLLSSTLRLAAFQPGGRR